MAFLGFQWKVGVLRSPSSVVRLELSTPSLWHQAVLLTAGFLQFSAHIWSSKTAKNSRGIQVQMLGLSSLLSPFLWDFLLGFSLLWQPWIPTWLFSLLWWLPSARGLECHVSWLGVGVGGGAGEVCVSSSFCLGLVVFCYLKAVVVLYFLQGLKWSLKREVVYIKLLYQYQDTGV